jgi:hypothetical protein
MTCAGILRYLEADFKVQKKKKNWGRGGHDHLPLNIVLYYCRQDDEDILPKKRGTVLIFLPGKTK